MNRKAKLEHNLVKMDGNAHRTGKLRTTRIIARRGKWNINRGTISTKEKLEERK